MGNLASVVHSLRDIGFRVRISKDTEQLDQFDILILPGVGAFPAAMATLYDRGLVDYLQEYARKQRPLIGICLGMQLLVSASYEHECTDGLNLIPGEILQFIDHRAHIGWNTLECIANDDFLIKNDGQAFYFNHSYYYEGPTEYHLAMTRHQTEFPAIIRRGSVVGLQFHPEKSQDAGKKLLKNIIMKLVHA